MLVFASPVPSAFSGFGALQPRAVPRPSPEEQYFLTLAEEHERAASYARQRLQQVQLARKQQHDAMEAQLRLQQQLAASLQVRTPQRSPYHTPARHAFSRALPLQDMNMILEFDPNDNDSCDAYAERMHRRTQERQKRAEEEAVLRALFEGQRRSQAERVADLHRQRAQEAKAKAQAQHEAQEKQARQQQARQQLEARAAEEQKVRQFFEALTEAMKANSELQGADLERKNAIRRNSVPVQVETPAPVRAPAPASAPVSPKAPVRSASPAPSTASDASDASLHSIAHLQEKYDSLRAGFTFPSDLVFTPASSSPAASPSLMYNPTNAPVHAYENALTKLLTELDAVESFGDEHVRDVRRSLARNVESELEALEEKKREAWRKQQDAAPVVESTPAPVSAPAPVEVQPIPVEAESTPAPVESALAVESSPVDPLAWLASRLSKESQPEEDEELKAVRENLLARLAPLAPAFEPTPVVESAPVQPTPVVEAVEPVPVVEAAPVEEPTKSVAPVEVPEATEEPTVAAVIGSESTPAESESAPAEPEVEVAPVTAPEPESEPAAIESTPTEAEAAPAPVSETVTEAEPTAPTTEAAPAPTPAPESIVEPAPVTEAEVESVSSTSTSASEPEIVAPVPESTKPASFVQVFPESDSDSDAETDADVVSELADRKSGDEFEMI